MLHSSLNILSLGFLFVFVFVFVFVFLFGSVFVFSFVFAFVFVFVSIFVFVSEFVFVMPYSVFKCTVLRCGLHTYSVWVSYLSEAHTLLRPDIA